MFRWRLLVLVTGFCGLFVWNASAQMLTEEQALTQMLTEEQALTRMRMEHPEVSALRFTVRELEANVRERRLLTNPKVGYTREDTGFNVDEYLLVTQELPMWGRLKLLGQAAGQAVSAGEERAASKLLTLETELRFAFTDLLLTQERVKTLERGVSAMTSLVDVLQVREEEGEGSLFDRLRTEREVFEIETNLETATVDRLTAQARLTSFFAPGTDSLGMTAVGQLTKHQTVLTFDSLVAKAFQRRPDYRALMLSEEQWETERRAAERLRLPEVAVTAGLKRTGNLMARESGYVVMATIGVPLLNRGQEQVARAEAARMRTDAERKALGARIESDVRVEHATASRYRKLADSYRVGSVDRAAKLLEIATDAYEEGEYGILEVLDAHNVKLRSELRLLELSGVARRATIKLDRAIGGQTRP